MAWKTAKGSEVSESKAPVEAPKSAAGNTAHDQLKAEFERAYNGEITIDEAERLAGRFLTARMETADELKSAKLDARMKKRGLKAVKSKVRSDEIAKHEKKPTEGQLDDTVNTSELVGVAERQFDEAEVEAEHLDAYLEIYKDAHIYFRGISKGRYE